MKKFINILAIALGLMVGFSSIIAMAKPGYKMVKLAVDHRDEMLDLHIWYPSETGGELTALGKNAVFVGHEVYSNAKPKQQRFPLILLSHGSGGNGINIGWIASYLADLGMIVVAPNHPGTTSRDSIPQKTLKIWERPNDMTAIINYFEQSSDDDILVNMQKIGIVGFSLGGHTALSMAGLQVNKQKYIDYCDENTQFLDCAWFNKAKVDLASIHQQKYEQNNLDKRIKAVVAIDPALAQAYVTKGLDGILTPIKIINLGNDAVVPAGINAKKIAEKLGHSEHVNILGATHFSFLGVCTMIGEIIISVAGDEAICSEVSDRTRFDIHQALEREISQFLLDKLN